jgi:hypothetical protein
MADWGSSETDVWQADNILKARVARAGLIKRVVSMWRITHSTFDRVHTAVSWRFWAGSGKERSA